MTVVAADDPRALDRAAAELEAGRPVVVPTDTVYGLAARAADHAAVATIFEWKDRPRHQVMAVLVASLDQARSLANFTASASALADAFWPGPLTLVLERRDDATLALGAPSATVGVRWPKADFVVALARRVGPLTTTSANRHGLETPSSAAGVVTQLDRGDVLVVDGGELGGQPSTVVDATGPDPQVLRIGPVSERSVQVVSRADVSPDSRGPAGP
ncbi:MAG: L-threonylcarbamoyladenylate synthase [Acidimicrobiia bacterium]|nr:L-threonylcarbamoyladenylate synthase [Acidimicrobiia bacterium]